MPPCRMCDTNTVSKVTVKETGQLTCCKNSACKRYYHYKHHIPQINPSAKLVILLNYNYIINYDHYCPDNVLCSSCIQHFYISAAQYVLFIRFICTLCTEPSDSEGRVRKELMELLLDKTVSSGICR